MLAALYVPLPPPLHAEATTSMCRPAAPSTCPRHPLYVPPLPPLRASVSSINPILLLQLLFATQDHETAQSAVCNLNNVDCGGQPLRIDLVDSDPFLEGKTTMHGELINNPTSGPLFLCHTSDFS